MKLAILSAMPGQHSILKHMKEKPQPMLAEERITMSFWELFFHDSPHITSLRLKRLTSFLSVDVLIERSYTSAVDRLNVGGRRPWEV